MTSERSGWRKFSEPMSNHSFCNKYINKVFPVMNSKCMADKFRRYLTSSFPRFDRRFISCLFLIHNFFHEFRVYKRPLFTRSPHYFFLLCTMYLSEYFFFFLVFPTAGLPAYVLGVVIPIPDLASPPPCG